MFKFSVICNEPPIIHHGDQATWNRIRVLPFETTFTDKSPATYEEQLLEKKFPKDPFFREKIPGIVEAFAWLLLEHRKKGIRSPEPEKVKASTALYQKKNDIYRQFIEESITESKKGVIYIQEIYNVFKLWYKESVPNTSNIPTKSEVKEYIIKLWGEPNIGKWKGYKVIENKDSVRGGGVITEGKKLEEDDEDEDENKEDENEDVEEKKIYNKNKDKVKINIEEEKEDYEQYCYKQEVEEKISYETR
jgi:phage/plasmid-associated DNA primase